jgi:uncharacterized protein YndB with AHSA1/START domain
MENAKKELTLERTYDAPVDLVFKAWMDPKLIAQWWGPQGFTAPVCEVDATVGGKINIVMEDSAGLIAKGSKYPMTGEFKEIDTPKKIVFTSSAIMNDKPILENLVTVTFDEIDGKTKMIVHIVVTKATPEAEMPLQGMEMGWNQQLDKLGEFLKR